MWYNSIFTPDIFQTWFNDWIRFFSEEKCLNSLVAWWIWIKSAWIWDLWQNLVMLTCLLHFHVWIESLWFSFISYNSQFSIKILKTASKKPVGFNSLFYKFYSGTFFMIATATTTTLCLNYNPVPLCMLPFLKLFFLKMLLLVNTQTNHETACSIF